MRTMRRRERNAWMRTLHDIRNLPTTVSRDPVQVRLREFEDTRQQIKALPEVPRG